jgi:hypothetical protein
MTGFAQEGLLHGIVFLEGSERPIAEATVQLQGVSTTTDASGTFSIPYDDSKHAQLVIRHVSFEKRQLHGPFDPTEILRVALVARIVQLEPATIMADPPPEIVYESKELHVARYLVSADGIWMLNYVKPRMIRRESEASLDIFDDVELVLLDENFNVIDSENLPDGMLGMYKDHEGNILLRSKAGDLHAQYFNEHILLDRLEDGVLDERLSWNDSIYGQLLGSNFIDTYPAFDHFAYNPGKDQSRLIHSVEDKHLMSLFRAEIKYMSGRGRVMARNLELQTGIDKEIHAAYMTGFYNDKYFEPLYAPLIVTNDTVLIFDHYDNEIKRFRADLLEAGSVPIDYHLGRKGRAWKKKLLHDDRTDKVYAVFARNTVTWLQEIDPADGSLGEALELHYRYPEQVQVYNGYVYYVYRTFGSQQKKTLYREAFK